jgi:hypothetical protein
MSQWHSDPSFEALSNLARRIEAVVAKSNELMLKIAAGDATKIWDEVIEVQAKLLRLDSFAKRGFKEALEEKRVRTLAHSNLVMVCVLASAVALSQFKHHPKPATRGMTARIVKKLRLHSTNGVSLAALSLTTFYALMGRGLLKTIRLKTRQKTVDA